MPDTTFRHIAMLSLVPGRPAKITTRELHTKLKALGHDINIRSIERDLPKLSQMFPLINDDGRPAGWSWETKEMRMSFPRMDVGTALTYELLSRYLAPVLPRHMRNHLEPDFAQAKMVLNQLQSSPLGRWSKRIAVLPFGHQLIPPEVKRDVSEIVYDALLNGKRFEANYRSLEAGTPKAYIFNPLGLIYRQGVLYLIATLWDYDDVRHFALHRMSNATRRHESVTAIDGFDFERYVREEKSFDYPDGKLIRLELVVEPWLARHLDESRLSDDQTIQAIQGTDTFRVIASVLNTEQLFWWLRSLGPDVEITKPTTMRKKMIVQTALLAAKYSKTRRR